MPVRTLVIAGGIMLLAIGGVVLSITQYYSARFLPKTTIDGVPVGGLHPEEARAIVLKSQPPLTSGVISLAFDEQSWTSSGSDLGLHRSIDSTIEEVFTKTHSSSRITQLTEIVSMFFEGKSYESTYQFNPELVASFVESVRPEIETAGTTPSATLRFSNSPLSISIDRGKYGREIRTSETAQNILANATTQNIELPLIVASTSAELSDTELVEYRERVARLVGQAARLESKYGSLLLNDVALVQMTAYPRGLHPSLVAETLAEWESRFATTAQDAVFEYDPITLEVSTFLPDRPHTTLDHTRAALALEKAIENKLSNSESPSTTSAPEEFFSIELPILTTPAAQTLANTNTLGIHERIAFGESEYANSIPTRVFNVAHTAEKINNTIIPPGEEFSFNKALGDVSRATGFQPAYIILNGRTVLGDGGGVCQVSTTLFRALLDGGLLITKRLPHSYRVSYYELNAKPGLDATVYSGEVDLRFKNDTGHHVLLHTVVDSENTYMSVELYGTSDGRTAEIVDHLVWGNTPPLATQFIPDPTLPPGKRKQIDWAVGGVKTSFVNVIKDAEGKIIREDKYLSNYRPWAAKYLVGVEPEQL